MWNFAGRESDVQGAGFVGLLDAFDDVPEVLASNKGRNIFYGLPLLLGLFGMFVGIGWNFDSGEASCGAQTSCLSATFIDSLGGLTLLQPFHILG